MFISNSKFYVKSTISSTQGTWTTFNISEDFETGLNIDSDWEVLSIVLKTNTQIERLTITCVWWVATIVKRWLTQWDTKVEQVWLQKQWTDWTIWYVTALASDMLDIDWNNVFSWDNTFTWNIDFEWNVFLEKWFRVPEFANETARDTAITSPSDWMLCYLQDVEDYYSFKNWIWVKGLWGSGWSVTWYQDSTADWSITWTINWVNDTFELSNTPAQPQAVILAYNWQALDYWDDYTISGKTITMILIPVSGRLTAYYPDTPVWTWSADTRVTSNSDAHNWELYRSTDDSNNLYYKDDTWTTTRIYKESSNKIDWANVDYTWVDLTWNVSQATESLAWKIEIATTSEATTWTNDTLAMTPLKTKDSIKDCVSTSFTGKAFDTVHWPTTEAWFVIASRQSWSWVVWVVWYIWATSTPTLPSSTSAFSTNPACICFIVPKGWYYRVNRHVSYGWEVENMNFIPLR